MTDDELEIKLREYEKLKDEQIARIGHRDNLIYVVLASSGVVASYYLSSGSNSDLLLAIPWLGIVLGWTYLVNDEKVSAIGRYIRRSVASTVREARVPAARGELFGWEVAHRSDPRRRRRKIEQLVVDEVTFVGSSAAALSLYWMSAQDPHPGARIIFWVEVVAVGVLFVEMVLYADISGKP
ncbi:MAG TPA: hypothetical protein VG826_33135 [Pirellulales bacterium]|nr:hypothetical protein [Pirellulales bacterium]